MKRPAFHRKLSADRWRRRRLRRRALSLAAAGTTALLLVLADRAGWFGRPRPPDIPRYDGKTFTVLCVIDGDTFDVNCPDGDYPHTRIRLWGVDTPETVRPEHRVEHFGPEASDRTKHLVLHKPVRLELLAHRTRDKYDRLLAYVYLPDGTLLNRELIAGGYGFADTRFDHPRQREFLRQQRQARRHKRGLWADPHPEDWPDYVAKE